MANHKGNIGINVGISRFLNLNANTLLIGQRERASGDTRDKTKGYTITNLTIIGKIPPLPPFEKGGSMGD